jgi:hypothetical protein
MSIARQMGLIYIIFRVYRVIAIRYGLLKVLYPVNVLFLRFLTIEHWLRNAKPFFFDSVNKYPYSDNEKMQLATEVKAIKDGKILFFTREWISLGIDYDWFTNPENGYRFDKNMHWTKVKDITTTQGDIKYIWEKARFTYLLTIIRNDQANNEDNSSFVWTEILSWIKNTTYNCGPHYKCSQEISLRLLNWITALYFYKNSQTLSEEIFNEIVNSIYWQTKHVEQNILFSIIAVRNNHAVTESLCLFAVGVLFPWFTESKRWLNKGKRFLEEEGLYQIYEDGSYIQHSFNYQRVVTQLYTWAIALANCNSIFFSTKLMDRLKKSVLFLKQFTDTENGYVPNWGANDSALFFPLNCCNPKDFRPQVNALHALLFGKRLFDESELQEDAVWFSSKKKSLKISDDESGKKCGIQTFPNGGYYVLSSVNATVFIRCARYRHRPYHADNLHFDLWYNHENLLRDAGTFKYNTEPEYSRFFTGTAGHNTVMIDQFDQMDKGARFIWYNWSEALNVDVVDEEEFMHFSGTIHAFKHLRKGIFHRRVIKAHKKIPLWLVYDFLSGADGHQCSQHWNVSDFFFERGFNIVTVSKEKELVPQIETSWYSEYYGQKELAKKIVFCSTDAEFTTVIYNKTQQNMIGKYL